MSSTTEEFAPPPPVHDEIALHSWGEFREAVAMIAGKYGHHTKGDDRQYRNEIVYRGHRCATWSLDTTLEREGCRDMTVLQYVDRAGRYRTHLEALSGTSWEMPDHRGVVEHLAKHRQSLWFTPPAYSYLVYLRHHGFPSPLLDWSLSPYVAAFFAFQDVVPKQGECVAVYAFIETPMGMKSGAIGAPSITLLGPHVRTHRRHFVQQALYTWCVQEEEKEGEGESQFIIRSHHDVLKHSHGREQDRLIRITLPSTEKKAVLQDLMAHNINAYTLYGSEDSLVKTLATKAFVLD